MTSHWRNSAGCIFVRLSGYMECQSLSYRTGIQGLRHTFRRVPKGYGDIFDDEHCVSSADRWSVGEDHTDFRGYVASMRLGS